MKIEVPFDKLLFDGDLKQHGHMLHTFHEHDIYTIHHYSDLESQLGEGWLCPVPNSLRSQYGQASVAY